MEKKIIISLFFIFLLFSSFPGVFAEPVYPEEVVGKRVYDVSEVLTSDEKQKLEDIIVKIEETTTSQFVIILIPTLDDENIDDYSSDVFDKMGIGLKDKDNGVLFVVDTNLDEHKARIEIGYGSSTKYTGGEAGRIRRECFNDNFGEGRWFEGLECGLYKSWYEVSNVDISQYVPDEYKENQTTTSTPEDSEEEGWSFLDEEQPWMGEDGKIKIGWFIFFIVLVVIALIICPDLIWMALGFGGGKSGGGLGGGSSGGGGSGGDY